MKKLFVLAVMLVLCASAGLAQEKTYDVPGVFSFKYTDGWNKGPRKGGTANELDWLVSASTPSASFHAVIARADFSFDDWLRRTIKQATPDRALVSKSEFVTAEGNRGYKLTWNIKAPSGQTLTSYNYMFSGKGSSQLLLSGIVDTANAAKFEPIFDTFAKSLVVSKGN